MNDGTEVINKWSHIEVRSTLLWETTITKYDIDYYNKKYWIN